MQEISVKFSPCQKTNKLIQNQIDDCDSKLLQKKDLLDTHTKQIFEMTQKIKEHSIKQDRIANCSFLINQPSNSQEETTKLTSEEEKRLSLLTLVLDHTGIKQDSQNSKKYRYEVFKNNRQVFKSRYTVLDRPSWKNERCPIRLKSREDIFQVHIFCTSQIQKQIQDSKGDLKQELFDYFQIPNPLKDLDPSIFFQKPVRQIEIDSNQKKNIKYRFYYEWNEIGMNFRLAGQISKQRQEISKTVDQVNRQIKTLEKEKDQLKGSLLTQYSMNFINIEDKNLEQQFKSNQELQDSFQNFGAMAVENERQKYDTPTRQSKAQNKRNTGGYSNSQFFSPTSRGPLTSINEINEESIIFEKADEEILENEPSPEVPNEIFSSNTKKQIYDTNLSALMSADSPEVPNEIFSAHKNTNQNAFQLPNEYKSPVFQAELDIEANINETFSIKKVSSDIKQTGVQESMFQLGASGKYRKVTPKPKNKRKKNGKRSNDRTGMNQHTHKFSPMVMEDDYMDNNIKDFNVNDMDKVEPNDQQYFSPDKQNENEQQLNFQILSKGTSIQGDDSSQKKSNASINKIQFNQFGQMQQPSYTGIFGRLNQSHTNSQSRIQEKDEGTPADLYYQKEYALNSQRRKTIGQRPTQTPQNQKILEPIDELTNLSPSYLKLGHQTPSHNVNQTPRASHMNHMMFKANSDVKSVHTANQSHIRKMNLNMNSGFVNNNLQRQSMNQAYSNNDYTSNIDGRSQMLARKSQGQSSGNGKSFQSMGQFSSVGMMFKCLGGSSMNGNFMMQNILNQQANVRNSIINDNNSQNYSLTSGDKAQRHPFDDLGAGGSIDSRSNNSITKHQKSQSGDIDFKGFKNFNLNLNFINSPDRLNSSQSELDNLDSARKQASFRQKSASNIKSKRKLSESQVEQNKNIFKDIKEYSDVVPHTAGQTTPNDFSFSEDQPSNQPQTKAAQKPSLNNRKFIKHLAIPNSQPKSQNQSPNSPFSYNDNDSSQQKEDIKNANDLPPSETPSFISKQKKLKDVGSHLVENNGLNSKQSHQISQKKPMISPFMGINHLAGGPMHVNQFNIMMSMNQQNSNTKQK